MILWVNYLPVLLKQATMDYFFSNKTSTNMIIQTVFWSVPLYLCFEPTVMESISQHPYLQVTNLFKKNKIIEGIFGSS